jgi:excinuclease UvrABC nuclease subunit
MAADRKFRVMMSERCFRFKPDALPSHAPQKPGVYEFVTFDENRNPTVLFVGLALDKTVYDCLAAHMQGQQEPTAAQLFGAAKDIYFDYVADADIEALDDLKDIAGFYVGKHKPRFNSGPAPSSGKYAAVTVEEA